MAFCGVEMEGRSFVAPREYPKYERRKPIAGELEGIFRKKIDKVVTDETTCRKRELVSISYLSPITWIEHPGGKNVILEEERNKVTEILFGVMQEYGFHPDRFSLKTRRFPAEPRKLWGPWGYPRYDIEGIRTYPTNYKNMFFKSYTMIKENMRVLLVTWYVGR